MKYIPLTTSIATFALTASLAAPSSAEESPSPIAAPASPEDVPSTGSEASLDPTPDSGSEATSPPLAGPVADESGTPSASAERTSTEEAPPPTAAPPSSAPQKLRPLSTDRPDTTESPYTVDRGHFQAEFDVARVTMDAGTESYSFMSSNLKIGITSFWEVQLVIDGLVGLPTALGHDWGAGDMDLRTKFNLVGNDSGPVAIAVMPWFHFPRVGTTEQIEGGLIGLLGWQLPADFATGFMVQADAAQNELDVDYHLELLHTWTVGHPIIGPLGAYIEAFGVYSSEAGAEYALSVDGGLTFAVTEYVQLDAGVVGGLTEPADDLSIFSGLSFKL